MAKNADPRVLPDAPDRGDHDGRDSSPTEPNDERDGLHPASFASACYARIGASACSRRSPLAIFSSRTTLELVQIAAAGGGFKLDASSRPTIELVQIAAAAGNKGARVSFVGLGTRPTSELVQIAAAGKGCVSFE